MKIYSADFVISNTDYRKCPSPDRPEYAFIGRSNVGKSSLINMLTENNKLAKTSGTPGKTQLINHFSINNQWYMVDLPGYGFAKVSKDQRKKFKSINESYLIHRKNLLNTFILVDSRHEPQKIDLEFMEWMGVNGLPFVIVMTKLDKLSKSQFDKNLKTYENKLLEVWEECPIIIGTSSEDGRGKDEIFDYIEEHNQLMSK